MRLILAIAAIGTLPYSLADEAPSDCGPVPAKLPGGAKCARGAPCNDNFGYKGNEATCPKGHTIIGLDESKQWQFVPELVCVKKEWMPQYTVPFKSTGYQCYEKQGKCEFNPLDCPSGKSCVPPDISESKSLAKCPPNSRLITNDKNKFIAQLFYQCVPWNNIEWLLWQPAGSALEINCEAPPTAATTITSTTENPTTTEEQTTEQETTEATTEKAEEETTEAETEASEAPGKHEEGRGRKWNDLRNRRRCRRCSCHRWRSGRNLRYEEEGRRRQRKGQGKRQGKGQEEGKGGGINRRIVAWHRFRAGRGRHGLNTLREYSQIEETVISHLNSPIVS